MTVYEFVSHTDITDFDVYATNETTFKKFQKERKLFDFIYLKEFTCLGLMFDSIGNSTLFAAMIETEEAPTLYIIMDDIIYDRYMNIKYREMEAKINEID